MFLSYRCWCRVKFVGEGTDQRGGAESKSRLAEFEFSRFGFAPGTGDQMVHSGVADEFQTGLGVLQ